MGKMKTMYYHKKIYGSTIIGYIEQNKLKKYRANYYKGFDTFDTLAQARQHMEKHGFTYNPNITSLRKGYDDIQTGEPNI